MNLGKSLMNARKNAAMSQEEVADKLGVSRQTISKWELNETTPDINQAKKLSSLYNISLDELAGFDIEIKRIEDAIERTSEEVQAKVNWTKVWSKKYPVLATYQDKVDIAKYYLRLRILLEDLKDTYGYNELDAVLVLKDILAHEMKR